MWAAGWVTFYLYNHINRIDADIASLVSYLNAREEVIPKLHVTHQLIIPVKLA